MREGELKMWCLSGQHIICASGQLSQRSGSVGREQGKRQSPDDTKVKGQERQSSNDVSLYIHPL